MFDKNHSKFIVLLKWLCIDNLQYSYNLVLYIS